MSEEIQPRGASAGLQRSPAQAWMAHHRDTARDSLRRLLRTPLSSLMTWLVLAVALALPTGLQVFLENLREVTRGLETGSQVSLYLDPSLSESQVHELADRVASRPQIGRVELTTAAQALEEFRQLAGWRDALMHLEDNPLPAVVTVHPLLQGLSPEALEALAADLQTVAGVERVQIDMQWVKRLYAFHELLGRGWLAIALLLGLATLLIIGNTIRLAIESRREEVVVIKLVGATDDYVRRPFLYTGFWFGLGAAVLAWLMVSAVLWWLQSPVAELAALYNSQFTLRGLSLAGGATLLLIGGGLGVSGAWLAVKRHLDAVEPE